MLEKVRSKDGNLVAKYDGRWLASSVRPIEEAQKWVSQLPVTIHKVRTVIVLGVGCGYHLKALAKTLNNKKILAIDTNADFIKFCDEHHGVDLAHVQFAQASDTTELFKNNKLIKTIQASYFIVEYKPVVELDIEKYAELKTNLLGRDFSAFRELYNKREDLKKILSIYKPTIDVSEPLTIKLLIHMLKDNSGDCNAKMLRILRELVK
jgi:hypothetical protein